MSQVKVTRWNGEPISEPGIYSGVPMSVYHGAHLCDGPSISSSGLRSIFTKSPMEYWIASPYNPLRQDDGEESEAFILGRAAHHLILGEADFAKYFVARPERIHDPKDGEVAWNSNRTSCKEWLQHCADQGLTVLTPTQIESIRGMAGLLPWQKGLEDSGLVNSVIARPALSGLVEHTIVARDEETGVWLKARPDAIPLDTTEGTDFKTTVNVDDRSIQKTLDDYRYDMQGVLASMCLEQAAGFALTSFALIFAMKKAPHAVRVIEMKPSDLAEAEQDLRTAIRTFARCMETGRWPGPAGSAGDAAYIERSTFNRERAANRRAFLEMELKAA